MHENGQTGNSHGTLSGDSFRALVNGENHGWWHSLQRGGLWGASVPYSLLTRLRNRLYDSGWKTSHRVPVPVVSVGNLTLGGTGKTPCVEYLAGFFQQHNRRTAILSRGYGSARGPNDEALVLQDNLPQVPHLQGPDRVFLANEAIKNFRSEILVLDDGFQHRRLARDLDIVLVDATQPWEPHLFPRGLLRESYEGLRRAGFVLLTRCDQVESRKRGRLKEAIAHYAPAVPIAESNHGPVHLINAAREVAALAELHDRPVAAFCGIGNPHAFRKTLADLGARVSTFRTFPDHHPYSSRDWEELNRWAQQQEAESLVLTTQKDLVKLRHLRLGGKPLWALRIRLHIQEGQEVLDQKLTEIIGIMDRKPQIAEVH